MAPYRPARSRARAQQPLPQTSRQHMVLSNCNPTAALSTPPCLQPRSQQGRMPRGGGVLLQHHCPSSTCPTCPMMHTRLCCKLSSFSSKQSACAFNPLGQQCHGLEGPQDAVCLFSTTSNGVLAQHHIQRCACSAQVSAISHQLRRACAAPPQQRAHCVNGSAQSGPAQPKPSCRTSQVPSNGRVSCLMYPKYVLYTILSGLPVVPFTHVPTPRRVPCPTL